MKPLPPTTATDPLAHALATAREPTTSGWEDAWVGIEPTFQNKKLVRMWEKMADSPEGEARYFASDYVTGKQKKLAKAILARWKKARAAGEPACIFAKAERAKEEDPYGERRQTVKLHWADPELDAMDLRVDADAETLEVTSKPVPLAWFYEPRFVSLLERFVWRPAAAEGLAPSIAHGGAQFSFSAKTWMGGSLLCDHVADRLSHPELATWIFDWPNCDDRSFRATRARTAAFRRCIDRYWEGRFHPEAIGVLTVHDILLDRGFGPAEAAHPELIDGDRGPRGDTLALFRTNFAFGRALRRDAQNVDPGYWQAAHPDLDAYRPDQIMRYSEANLNRLQIAGEYHVKHGKILDPERVMDASAPLTPDMLYHDASYEIRGQMGRTSARDFVEALLLEVHHARWLERHPHVPVIGSLLQDQLLGDAAETLVRWAPEVLERLRKEARAYNRELSQGRLESDWIEPEAAFYEAWKALPSGERAAIADEVVRAFIERVQRAAEHDPRPGGGDPMEWHRHRVHPILWEALGTGLVELRPEVQRELARFAAQREQYLARRPPWSPVDRKPPWST